MNNYNWAYIFLFIAFILCVILMNTVQADTTNATLSTSRGGTTNYDEIKVGDVSCRQAMISATQLEFGVGQLYNNANGVEPENEDGQAVFARITYQLGMPDRIDCSRIYEMELERLRFQLYQLRQELN